MSSVGTQRNTFNDASGRVTVAVFSHQGSPAQAHWIEEEILVGDSDMIAIGGGGTATDFPQGNLLTSSHPNDDLSGWVVSSKEHEVPNPVELVTYVIGLKIAGMNRQDLLRSVFVSQADSGVAPQPEAETGVPSDGFVLVGGGFKVDWHGMGNLATASFPSTEFSWKTRSKDHDISDPANLRVFAIGLRRNLPVGKVIGVIAKADSGQANHPAADATVAPGFALTGGGAEVHFNGDGNLLWKLEASTSLAPTFSAASKDHLHPDPSTLTAYALGICLALPVDGFGGAAQGWPRNSFTLPVLISPTASPTDQTLFEEPQDGTKKHYLPRYGIAATASGGSPVKWVVFQQLEGVSSGLPPWNIVRVNWNGRPYVYYQDRRQPCNLYFLPEAFKIGRQPKPPHRPSLLVSTNGEDVNSLTLTLSYLSQPVWNPNRLAAAADALREQLSLEAQPAFALFEASNTSTRLSLKLPSDDPSTPPGLVPQPGAIIDIAAGIQGSVTLKLPQFRQVYDALFDEVSELLSGQVAVTVDQDVEAIPFTARASDFVGDIFDTKTAIDAQSNRVVVVLQNSIESTIHVDNLLAVLKRGGNAVPNSVEQISPTLPADLPPAHPGSPPAPAGSVTVTLQSAPGQLVDGSCTVLFDFSQTRVVPDSKAIWHAILENRVVGPVARPIRLKLVASLLTTSSAAPVSAATEVAPASSGSIMAVQVVFEDGQRQPSTPP
jgi:hypothetical protein